ncbi:putative malate dehydrogenase 1B [Limanda limanda]|uniref:putative malate dehydrogenase 1B n=1 Tax=Limanda limanda TaxID=27771 RepID=UPI0029C8069C|nr:putative malate dehydrogenase 1B [Limanda limanda]
MAKFVLAGKTDCPYYAKAELLADALQRCLPNFSIHKISILPDDWLEWLENTCQANNWKHEESPVIWRELVEQGGKGMLLGGFNDFVAHCLEYYNITSDMTMDTMLSIAAENLAAQLLLMEEEAHRLSLIKPLHLWISSALSPTSHFLIPNLLSAKVFPLASVISLHLLDLEGDEEDLQWLKMSAEDLAIPMLHQVTIHTDLELAFQGADVVLLLDENWASLSVSGEEWSNDSDAESVDEPENREKKMTVITDIYNEYGKLINSRANEEVKVIVAGDSFVNLRCSLLLDKAERIETHRFVAMATHLENEARSILSKKLKVMPSDVTNVYVWGNISGSFYVDVRRTNVYNFDGAIIGPSFFSQPILTIFHDRKWLETVFQDLVRCQRAAVAEKTCQASAMSNANGVLTILRAWNGQCTPGRVFSLGVLCPGSFDLQEGIVLSVPVTFTDDKWSLFEVNVSYELNERLQVSACELLTEREPLSEDYDDELDI